MATLENHQSSSSTKLLFIGDSGTGKTGALASLVKAGYSLRVWDFDNGLDILANILRKENPDLLKQVHYKTLTDPFRAAGANLIPAKAVAWTEAIKLLEGWEGLGPISSWGPKDIAVFDSITFAGKSVIRFIQQMNARLATPPQLQDYREAQILLENLCAALYSDSVKCNVICLSHIREVGKTRQEMTTSPGGKERLVTIEDADTRKGYAETGTGRAFSPQVGRYFNAVLMADIQGSGLSTRRIIRTQPHENIGLKNSAPGVVQPQYPLETGLAEFFKAVRVG